MKHFDDIQHKINHTFKVEAYRSQRLGNLLTLVLAHEAVVYVECDDLVRGQGLGEKRGTHRRVHATTHQQLAGQMYNVSHFMYA